MVKRYICGKILRHCVTYPEQFIDRENLNAHRVDEKRQLTSDVLVSEVLPVKLRYILIRFLREFGQSRALFNLQKNTYTNIVTIVIITVIVIISSTLCLQNNKPETC